MVGLFVLVGLFVASARATCERELHAGARWAAVKTLPDHDADRRRAVTGLMNEALRPALSNLAELTHARGTAFIRNLIQDLPRTEGVCQIRQFDSVLRQRDQYHFDGAFTGSHTCAGNVLAPFNAYNEHVMRRLVRAVRAVQKLVELNVAPLQKLIPAPLEHMLWRCSYAGPKIEAQTLVGGEALGQAAAQLTSDPVADLSPDALLRGVMSEGPHGPSLMVRLSLALPASVLGPHGYFVYVKNAVVRDGDDLKFSPRYREFLGRAHALNRARDGVTYRLDHGCPVAHRNAEGTSGLQSYLDAVMRIYDVIADDPATERGE